MPYNPTAPKRYSVSTSKKRFSLSYEDGLFLKAAAAGLPGGVVSFYLLWTLDFTLKVQLTFSLLIAGAWLGFALSVRERIVTTLRTVGNLLTALREGDFSLRAVVGRQKDALQDVAFEINSLGDILHEQRMHAMEASALLQKVMDEIEVAVFAFDPDGKLRFLNRHAEQLMDRPASALKGRTAEDLELRSLLEGEEPRLLEYAFPGRSGRWELRRGTFRQQGLPHSLVVVSDLTRTLREEERQAWKRLVQVLRHEINNSLAPIHSLGDSLQSMLRRQPRPNDWESDLQEGLSVITERSKSLNRFMTAYTQMTRLPKPVRQPLNLGKQVEQAVRLETRWPVELNPGPEVLLRADGDQLTQALINLIKNAVEAAQETGGAVRVSWSLPPRATPFVEIRIEDEGSGILNPENLFVPFFTTKAQGTGLGLMISRQIAEAHGGSLVLTNRTDRSGCRATLRLPVGLHRD